MHVEVLLIELPFQKKISLLIFEVNLKYLYLTLILFTVLDLIL